MVRQSRKNLQGLTAEVEGEKSKQKAVSVWGEERVLSTPDEIAYYHEYIKQIIIRNKLVGSVSDSGNYNLKDRVKRDLVKMPKQLVDECPSYYLAMAIYMNKTFNFVVDIEYSEDDIATASLYLNEAIADYPPVKSLRTFVAKVILPVDNNMHDKIFEAFHITKATNKVKDTDVPFLAVQMQGQADDALMLDEVSDLGSQIYIMRMLKVLSKGGEVGQKIVEEYKKEAEKAKLDVNNKGSYTKLHRMLDQTIQKNGGLEAIPLERQVLTKPMKEYTDALNKLNNAKTKKVAVNVKNIESSGDSEKSSSSPKKPAAKSAKPAAKKPEKKAEKKKDSKKAGKDDDKGKSKSGPSDYASSVVTTVKSLGGNTKIAGNYVRESKPQELPHQESPVEEEPTEEEDFDAFDGDDVADFITSNGDINLGLDEVENRLSESEDIIDNLNDGQVEYAIEHIEITSEVSIQHIVEEESEQ